MTKMGKWLAEHHDDLDIAAEDADFVRKDMDIERRHEEADEILVLIAKHATQGPIRGTARFLEAYKRMVKRYA